MDQFEELEKYKELLDLGAITEDEFQLLKQQLLGLKTDAEKEAEREAERAEALKDIEAMRAEETEHLEQDDLACGDLEPKGHETQASKVETIQTYSEARPEGNAYSDLSQSPKERVVDLTEEKVRKDRSTTRTVFSVIKSIGLWALCLFLLFIGIPTYANGENVFYILIGIMCIILAVLACPLVTSLTRNIPTFSAFYRVKRPVVIILVVAMFVFLVLA